MGGKKKTTKTKAPASKKPPSKDRNPKGQFVPGWTGGPGRPPAEREAEYLRAFREVVNISQWQQVIEKLLSEALDGRQWAVKLLVRHALPAPPQRLTLEGEFTRSQNEFRVAGQSAGQVNEEMLGTILTRVEERRRYEQGLAASKVPGYEHAINLKSVDELTGKNGSAKARAKSARK